MRDRAEPVGADECARLLQESSAAVRVGHRRRVSQCGVDRTGTVFYNCRATSTDGEFVMSRTRTTLVLLLACVAQFMLLIDDTITNVALPTIARELHFSESNL